MAFLVMNRTQGLGEERGAGRWGCIGFFVHKEGLAETSGEGYGFYKVGHWTLGILRARKSPQPTLGPLITYKKIS